MNYVNRWEGVARVPEPSEGPPVRATWRRNPLPPGEGPSAPCEGHPLRGPPCESHPLQGPPAKATPCECHLVKDPLRGSPTARTHCEGHMVKDPLTSESTGVEYTVCTAGLLTLRILGSRWDERLVKGLFTVGDFIPGLGKRWNLVWIDWKHVF